MPEPRARPRSQRILRQRHAERDSCDADQQGHRDERRDDVDRELGREQRRRPNRRRRQPPQDALLAVRARGATVSVLTVSVASVMHDERWRERRR